MNAGILSREENLFDFFHEAVDSAVHSEGGGVSEDGVATVKKVPVVE